MKRYIAIKERTNQIIKAARIRLAGIRRRIMQEMKRSCRMVCRVYCMAAAHKESIGYYAVLTLVLVALGAAANDYRSRRIEQHLTNALSDLDPGIVVQAQPDPTLAPEKPSPAFIMPVQGTIVRGFSDSELTWSTALQLWQTHPAVDVSAAVGEAVVAAAAGTVTEAYSDALYGNIITVQHEDGSVLRYCSLNTLQLVEVGQRIVQGQTLGSVGTCAAETELGAHVHLEYFADQRKQDFSVLTDGE